MKNKYIFWVVAFFLIVITSCQEEKTLNITNFTATEGTRVGLVRLTYEPISDAEDYEFQRKNPETDSWEQIAYIKGWVPDHLYDDQGYSFDNYSYKLKPGEVYEYQMRAWASGDYSNPWCPVATGYIFAPSPRMTKVQYEPNENPEIAGTFTFTIKDPLPNNLSNLFDRTITIYRAKATTSDFISLSLNNDRVEGTDSTIYVTSNAENSDAPYDYKFEIAYNYSYAVVSEEGSNLNGGYADYIYQSLIITSDDIDDGGSQEMVTYNIQNYNEINSSATGAKVGSIMCKDGSTVYLGYFDNWSLLDGTPALMKNTGSSWETAGGTLPTELLNDNSIDEFDFAVSDGTIYLAALSSDTLFVYKYDGSWSANLSTSILWGTTKPNYLNIALLNNELYLTVEQGEDIKVFKYESPNWVQVGSTIASGFYTDTKLKEIDGTLYIWYEGHVNGSTETSLFIKHLNGSNWDTDLQWTETSAVEFDVIKAGSDLYFKCGGLSSDFLGGIFKVTSTTTVTSLEKNELKIIPEAITSDAAGNIIATIMTAGATASDFQIGVYIYDGSVWKKVNDDFSEVSIHGNSSGVQTINNDIHFVYGLKSSENSSSNATILKAEKYSL